ncbi:HTTM domain-containing protein [Halorussus litoreus]|uniref:HTTM domain-containing protein n=1 Tax=Halorussus litoreus TaxID=1710536 RepID=UPI000E242FBE|nr:HTTM domain-containing protein [Halorussus litoreus]
MRARERASVTRARIRRFSDRCFGVDPRSLAAFRIGLGAVLLLDLLLRARNLRTFYTDEGILPVALLADQFPTLARLSLHARSGEALFQALLFAVALAAALALLVGYRTKFATGVSLCLLLSLHARNPYVLSGADALLQHLLFWTLFVPVGERWSVDAQLGGAGRERIARERIVSVGTVALLSQVLVVYGVNAILKARSDAWMSGDAVSVILSLDHFAVFLAPALRELPAVLWLANWAWVGLLLASPLLVLTTGRTRIALVGAFAGMHLGMLLTMSLEIFPLVSVVALLPFLPEGVWDSLGGNRRIARLKDGVSRSAAPLYSRLPAGSLDFLPPRIGRCRGTLARTVATLVLVGVLAFNATALGLVPVPAVTDDAGATADSTGSTADSTGATADGNGGVADPIAAVSDLTAAVADADPRWTMFAPHPPANDRWYVAPGELASGERVDAFGREELRWERPDALAGSYSSPRMRKYLSNVRGDERLLSSFADHLCSQWSRDREGDLETVAVYEVTAPSHAVGEDSRDRTELVRTACDERAT